MFTQTVPQSVPVVNAGFEQGAPGTPAPGWRSATATPLNILVSTDACRTGAQCAAVQAAPGETGAPGGPGAPGGALVQAIDAQAYRGKMIRYRASVRTDGAQAQLWFRVDLENGGQGFFDNMSDRPVRSAEWVTPQIDATVDPAARSILFGVILQGAGRVWVDDVSLDITGEVEPPRSLSAPGLQNLEALARLFGYVRYFHPSDQVAAADWNALAVRAVRAVEGAGTPAELATSLTSVFEPIAPTSRIVPTGSTARPSLAGNGPYVITWLHRGLGLSPQGIYRSARVILPVTDPGARRLPIRADLPGGVTAMVPILLGRQAAGSEAPLSSATRPGGSGDDRATRLAAVVVAWNVFQHFYPYFDLTKTDWPAELRAALSRAAIDANADAFQITLNRLVAALGDGHGAVAGRLQQPFGPPVVWTMAEGRVTALVVQGDIGVRPGDALVSVDGRPIADVLAAKEALISGATPQWIRYRALQELLAGARGRLIALELDPIDPAGARKRITVSASAIPQTIPEPRPDKVRELEPGIWYLDLNRIVDADYAAVLPSLAAATGIVFDLRGYPRVTQPAFLQNLTEKPLTSAQWHVPLVTAPDRQGMRFVRAGEWNLPPVAPLLTARRAFIVDGRAISYAESIMGIVEHYKLGEIVGEPTAGTNGNANPFAVPGGYQINWTGMKVLKHDGSRHHGVGIRPTVPVSRTRAGIAAGRDEMLERAVQVVKTR